ncbi:Ltp family lipoprotein [Gordonia sp. ABSL49_1]|uniref:Ltp family lipoprotein n=1 Tax=Gordonia sp. ABSL49_1 TaxID=2920941 RepID=UPI001F0FC9A2|nr:Ltp family lipoprotein [Gordonia sp. ABSL49_1]MCH5642264.1 Ltp family lipoprotein [Gordonia sp. ABSL49_1]
MMKVHKLPWVSALAAVAVIGGVAVTAGPVVGDVAVRDSGQMSIVLAGYTVSQQNAIGKAKEYLAISEFSRSGLIGQLKYEGFSESDATVAVDSLRVNWNAQAVKKAKEYLAISSFSHSGLVDQLEYEGFTSSQAEYGVRGAGL